LNEEGVTVGKLVAITVEEGGTRRVWEKDLPSNWDCISYTLQGVVKKAHGITDVEKQGTGCNIGGGKTKLKSRNSVEEVENSQEKLKCDITGKETTMEYFKKREGNGQPKHQTCPWRLQAHYLSFPHPKAAL